MVEPLKTTTPSSATIKFLCSYGGMILPRFPDAKLRYHGGHTRILSLPRSISFSELVVKLGDLCGTPSVSVRCQLPTEDLDALVSITSDEDLSNLIEEYDRASPSSLKIRAFLSPPKSSKKHSPHPSTTTASSSSSSSSTSTSSAASPTSPSSAAAGSTAAAPHRCIHRMMPSPSTFPICHEKSSAGKAPRCPYHVYGNPRSHIYLIHNGNHWQ